MMRSFGFGLWLMEPFHTRMPEEIDSKEFEKEVVRISKGLGFGRLINHELLENNKYLVFFENGIKPTSYELSQISPKVIDKVKIIKDSTLDEKVKEISGKIIRAWIE